MLQPRAFDIFKKMILVNKLLEPSIPIEDYKLRFSTVSAKMMW